LNWLELELLAGTTVTGIEMFKKSLEEGMAGDNAGVLLRGIRKLILNEAW